jgi:hypothetical protein
VIFTYSIIGANRQARDRTTEIAGLASDSSRQTLSAALNQRSDFWRRVVGRYVLGLVSEEQLAVLEADAGDPQSTTARSRLIVPGLRPLASRDRM